MWKLYKNKSRLSSIRYYFINEEKKSISFLYENNSRYTFYAKYIGEAHYHKLIHYAIQGYKVDRYIKHYQLEYLNDRNKEEADFLNILTNKTTNK
jgi:hypothetical protein